MANVSGAQQGRPVGCGSGDDFVGIHTLGNDIGIAHSILQGQYAPDLLNAFFRLVGGLFSLGRFDKDDGQIRILAVFNIL